MLNWFFGLFRKRWEHAHDTAPRPEHLRSGSTEIVRKVRYRPDAERVTRVVDPPRYAPHDIIKLYDAPLPVGLAAVVTEEAALQVEETAERDTFDAGGGSFGGGGASGSWDQPTTSAPEAPSQPSYDAPSYDPGPSTSFDSSSYTDSSFN